MQLTRYQKFASRWMKDLRVCLLLWRRQGGKSTLFAFTILKVLLEHPGILCTFVSASLSVGSELPYKATQIFGELLKTLREVSAGQESTSVRTERASTTATSWTCSTRAGSKSRSGTRSTSSPA